MSYEAIRRELRDLTDLLQAKEIQITFITKMFFQKERELQRHMDQLQAKYKQDPDGIDPGKA